MLDVGATLSATPDDLVRFAIMGVTYARIISRNPLPRVALLSNGEEANRGRPMIVEAYRRLASIHDLNFKGNIEGLDMPLGTVDVIVTSGFVGNIVQKMLAGVFVVAGDLTQYALAHSLRSRIGLLFLDRSVRKLLALTDCERYGGAPLLGLRQVVIKTHGQSGSKSIRNAIKVAAKAVRGDLCANIADGLAAVAGPGLESDPRSS